MADDDLKTRFWRFYMSHAPVVRHATTPWTALAAPLAASRVALVSTCGVHLAAQPPFDLAVRGGDPSFRELPADLDPADVAISHGHYDEAAARRDLNCVFPLQRLHELAAEGAIGAVAPRHYAFRGAIARPARLIRDTAPEVARRLKADAVDVVLLVPC